jgi:SagB-type dehydrogenase family enzyme
VPGLEAGVYHYGVHDNALRRLRSGDFRGPLVEATAGEQSIAAAPATIVFTSTYWRNAWKYQSRTYRHCFWDSGTIAANLLAIAAAHRLRARIVTGFADEPVNRLIGVDSEREAALFLVSLGQGAKQPPRQPDVEPISYETVPYSRFEVDYPAIREAHRASSVGTGEEVAAWRSVAASSEAPRPVAGGGDGELLSLEPTRVEGTTPSPYPVME